MTLKLDINVLIWVEVESKVDAVIIALDVLIFSVELINVEEVMTVEDEKEVDSGEDKGVVIKVGLVLEVEVGSKEVVGEYVCRSSVKPDAAVCVPNLVESVTSIVVITFVLLVDVIGSLVVVVVVVVDVVVVVVVAVIVVGGLVVVTTTTDSL